MTYHLWQLQDKHRASRQVEGYQDTLTDLKSRLACAVSDKDRLFQERFDLNQKVQELILEKEQLLKVSVGQGWQWDR